MNTNDVSSPGGLLATAALVPMMLGIIVASILIFGYPLYVIAQKQGHPTPWFAFVPILQAVLIMQLGDQNPWLLLLALIPCINLVAVVFVFLAWMKIAEKQGFPGWYGLLLLVPIVGIFVPFYLALASPPQQISRL